jgi:hypothetical protein
MRQFNSMRTTVCAHVEGSIRENYIYNNGLGVIRGESLRRMATFTTCS